MTHNGWVRAFYVLLAVAYGGLAWVVWPFLAALVEAFR
jgi:hypothetical protein